jgi:hypothetical protein
MRTAQAFPASVSSRPTRDAAIPVPTARVRKRRQLVRNAGQSSILECCGCHNADIALASIDCKFFHCFVHKSLCSLPICSLGVGRFRDRVSTKLLHVVAHSSGRLPGASLDRPAIEKRVNTDPHPSTFQRHGRFGADQPGLECYGTFAPHQYAALPPGPRGRSHRWCHRRLPVHWAWVGWA